MTFSIGVPGTDAVNQTALSVELELHLKLPSFNRINS